MKDQSFDMKFSSSSLDSARYSQSDAATTNSIGFSTSTPKKPIDIFYRLDDSDSENDVVHIKGISNTSTVPTSSSIDFKNISDTKLDSDVIEQLQIHNRRIWDRK